MAQRNEQKGAENRKVVENVVMMEKKVYSFFLLLGYIYFCLIFIHKI